MKNNTKPELTIAAYTAFKNALCDAETVTQVDSQVTELEAMYSIPRDAVERIKYWVGRRKERINLVSEIGRR